MQVGRDLEDRHCIMPLDLNGALGLVLGRSVRTSPPIVRSPDLASVPLVVGPRVSVAELILLEPTWVDESAVAPWVGLLGKV